jgi:CobQ-like glutamine amidotransferase family enzyme
MFDIQPCYNSPSDTIDMRIVHVIFDNPHGQTKDKLDKLNTYYSVHGNILNTYYHGGELDKNSSLVYVAGYPVVTANKAHYQSEVVKGWYNH